MESERKWFVCMIAVCLALMLLCIGAGELIIERDKKHEESLVHDMLMGSGVQVAQDIQRKVAEGIFVTETLGALLKAGDYKTEEYRKWGKLLVGKNLSVSAVELAPDGVIKYIYPLEGNEKAVGHDLLKDKRRDDGALKAMLSREVTFVGPVKLIQNGRYAVIARKPVFKKDKNDHEFFWGFTIALLYVDDIIPSRVSALEGKGILVRLEGDDPDATKRPVLYETKTWGGSESITINLDVPNGQWVLKMEHPVFEHKYCWLFRLGVFLFSGCAALYIFVQQFRMRMKSKEIMLLNERLTTLTLCDELTGVGNRRAGIKYLNQEMSRCDRYGQSLSVAMIDLDYFKRINDDYGHLIGDAFLKHVARNMKEAIRESDRVFRLGGDEFLIVFPQTGLKQCVVAVTKMASYLKKYPFNKGDVNIEIKLSTGVAEYSVKDSIESLIGRGDEKLYEAKNAGRETIRY